MNSQASFFYETDAKVLVNFTNDVMFVDFQTPHGCHELLISKEQAEQLYFKLSQCLFDGDLSAKPLPEMDNTKPADLDGPVDNYVLEIIEVDSPIR